MDWRQFVMDLGPLPPAAVEDVFTRFGAQAVTLSDAGDDPVLEPGVGETPLWSQTRITGLFSPDADFSALCDALSDEFALPALPPHRIEPLADRRWEREWLKDFHPMQFGSRLWVSPVGQQPPADDAIVVALDPGLAFGTGTHQTTALCLRWLDRQSLTGKALLDFGCGSGILGIAALKLGAASVVAVDIDPQAIAATKDNARQNEVEARIVATTERPLESFDIVLANILAAPLIEYAEWLTDRVRPGGALVLSGILAAQVERVLDAYRKRIDFDSPVLDNGWARLSGNKP
ncbi:MAG: 50S ribosomal protein L11 methyltransferase [Woeseia sp.]|nr:50S ribosomal protein L11 methyltransferase [Woeseia sp.]NNE61681.1 50S ribosomal protein L11 methyltransferase [Woeseia sp.]